MKKKKAFEQRGDMAVSAWAEQQQRELNLKARRMARLKVYWFMYPCMYIYTYIGTSLHMCIIYLIGF